MVNPCALAETPFKSYSEKELDIPIEAPPDDAGKHLGGAYMPRFHVIVKTQKNVIPNEQVLNCFCFS
jgi:hypothetical protein